ASIARTAEPNRGGRAEGDTVPCGTIEGRETTSLGTETVAHGVVRMFPVFSAWKREAANAADGFRRSRESACRIVSGEPEPRRLRTLPGPPGSPSLRSCQTSGMSPGLAKPNWMSTFGGNVEFDKNHVPILSR